MLREMQFRRSPGLGFPSSIVPGFDPSHPLAGASTYPIVSVVASGSTMLSVTSGKPATPTGSAAKQFGPIGPVVSYTGATDVSTLPWVTLSSIQSYINMAAIGYITSITTGASSLIATSTASVTGLGALASSGNFYAGIGGANADSGIPVVLNSPFMIAASARAFASGSTTVNFAFINLATGAIKTGSAAGNTSTGNTDGNVYFGNRGGTRVLNGGISAAMLSLPANQLSIQQLAQVVQDPWSFWYPRAFDTSLLLVGAGAAPVLNPVFTPFDVTPRMFTPDILSY